MVPYSVFRILDHITEVQTRRLRDLPKKLERQHLRDFAQLPERYQLARLTHNVSVFTQGILNMHTTLLGIVKLNPRQTLEEGIRKQLVLQISRALHESIEFKTGRTDEFEQRVVELVA